MGNRITKVIRSRWNHLKPGSHKFSTTNRNDAWDALTWLEDYHGRQIENAHVAPGWAGREYLIKFTKKG